MRRRAGFAAACLMLLWLTNQGWIANEDNPAGRIHRQLADFGHAPTDYALERYDARYGPLGRRIEATYARIDREGPSIHVEAMRQLAFQGWTITELSMGERAPE